MEYYPQNHPIHFYNKTLLQFIVGDTIRIEEFCKVKHAYDTENKRDVEIKILNDSLDKKTQEQIMIEVDAL